MRVLNIPRRRLYPFLGFLLAAFAPGGLLLIRALAYDRLFHRAWLSEELASRALTYGYVGVSTTLLFVGLGVILGTHEDLLRRISLTDSLTELPNRRHFEKRVRDELARVDRYNHPLALMMLDLDHLKRINDELGHEAGDNAIRAVARTLEKSCRATDFAVRFGGDEFAVLAPNITAEEAKKIADRIRSNLTTEASWVPEEIPPLTLSIGVADTSSIQHNHPDRLFSVADRALYEAKERGRDRVVVAPALGEPPALDGASPSPASQEV